MIQEAGEENVKYSSVIVVKLRLKVQKVRPHQIGKEFLQGTEEDFSNYHSMNSCFPLLCHLHNVYPLY